MIKLIKKYTNFLVLFWSTSLSIELEYRLNLIVDIFTLVGNLFGSLLVLSLFYTNHHTLGGWSWSAALVVLGLFTTLEGFTSSILQPNLSKIVRYVQLGTLDYVLLKPISSQYWLSFRYFSPWGIPSIIVGFLISIYGVISTSNQFNTISIICSIIMIISSLITLYSIWFILATTSIWFVKVWNVNEVLKSILIAGRFPISSYPNIVRTIFTFIIPIAFLTTIPAEALLGRLDVYWFLFSLIISATLLFTSIRFWLYALNFYTSASS